MRGITIFVPQGQQPYKFSIGDSIIHGGKVVAITQIKTFINSECTEVLIYTELGLVKSFINLPYMEEY